MIQQAIDFLREHPEGVLATVSDNRPQTRVFQVMKIEGTTLYFATAPQKAIWQQLQANPAVEFLLRHPRLLPSAHCPPRVLRPPSHATH